MNIRHRSRNSHHSMGHSSGSHSSRNNIPCETVKVEKISKHTWFEELNYKLDVLVPLNEETELSVPMDSYLQQVHYGRMQQWRVQRNENYNLPLYLTEHKEPEPVYFVSDEKKAWFGPLELGSSFLKKWDALTLSLLLFTASVTPFETAFIHEESINFDMLFLLNRFVDIIFFFDVFVQLRTPFRDEHSGKLIMDVKKISYRYLTSWFPLDIVSVIPFEFMSLLFISSETGSSNLSNLKLLRFVRLTRLLKLLRVFRASRKLKQAQIASGLRYVTIEFLKITVVIIFAIHWLACGYRLVAERTDPTEEAGWVDHLAEYKNHSLSSLEAYVGALYWASGSVSLVGIQGEFLAPTALRELFYAVFVNFLCFFLAIYYIASLNATISTAGETQRKKDLLLDNYLEMFDMLRLDPLLKFTVSQHLVDFFTTEENQRQTDMLRKLPKTLHCFISMEIYLNYVARIPFLEPFMDKFPVMIQEICQAIEKRNIPVNNFLFEEGCDGFYFIDEGIVSMDGLVYTSGSVLGFTCLRQNNKKIECRAIMDVKTNFLPRSALIEILDRNPKVKYYCMRWTAWEVLRIYIRTYSKLYYTAARRGALMSPPLLSRRPNMEEGEEDDIDVAVLDHIQEMGF